jgi:hypothetical protein
VLGRNLKDSTVDLLYVVWKLKKPSDSKAAGRFYYSRVLIQGQEENDTTARE